MEIMDNESVFMLIEAYKAKPVLWNPLDPNYYNRTLKKDAWDELGEILNRPVEELKKKIEYLQSALRRERAKFTKSKTTGQGVLVHYDAAALKQLYFPRPQWLCDVLDHVVTVRENNPFANNGADNVYKSTWFAYEHLSFLVDKNKPRGRITTEDSTKEKKTESEGEGESTESSDAAAAAAETETFTAPPTPTPTQKKKRKTTQQDPIVMEALELMRTSAAAATAYQPPAAPDSFQTYANYLASKFRTYSKRAYVTVEHEINNILFAADTGVYDGQSSSRTSTPSSPLPSNQNTPRRQSIDFQPYDSRTQSISDSNSVNDETEKYEFNDLIKFNHDHDYARS